MSNFIPTTNVKIKTFWQRSSSERLDSVNKEIEIIINTLSSAGVDKEVVERMMNRILEFQYEHGYDEGTHDAYMDLDPAEY